MKIRYGILLSINKYKDIKNGTFVIPNNVTEIGRSVFSGCKTLTSIVIPDNVTRIGSYAFYDCGRLTSVTIPDSVTSIGLCAFANCSSLTRVTIGNGVTNIDCSAFLECFSLYKKDKKYYYKAFNSNLTCKDFQYEENKWFEHEGEIEICKNGFHACKNAFDLFNYYYGELNKNIVIYKVELEGISEKIRFDSKVVAKRIRLVEKVNSYAELLN